MKKYIGIFGLVALFLVAALLVGCTSSGGESGTTTTTTSSSGFTTFTQTNSSTQSQTQTQTQSQTQTQTQTTTQTAMSLTDLLNMAAAHQSVYYEAVSNISGEGTVKSKCWMKSGKFRVEVEGTGIVTFLYTANLTMYIYVPQMNTVYHMKYDPTKAPVTPSTILTATPTIIGEETIDGKDCIIVQYTYQGSVVKAWIWKDTGFPVKVETTVSGITTITTFQNFSFADIDDSMFDLPAGVPVVDMSSFTELPITIPTIPSIPTP